MDDEFGTLSQSAVLELARTLGVELTSSGATEIARGASAILEEFEVASATAPSEAHSARHVVATRPDPEHNRFNAFIHRFDIQTTGHGRLAGRTVGIKDLIAISGVPRTRGRSDSSEWELSETDAEVVRRILSAGARLVGTLNLDLWGCGGTGESSEFGLALNPHGHNRLPGGSSSGSGVAVAAGEVELALGTDTAGSVRIPASWCGAVGMKGARGAVPAFGVIGLDPTLDATGPLAADVKSCATLYEVISGATLRPAVERPVIGIIEGVADECDAATTDALESARRALSAAGHPVREIRVRRWSEAWQIVSVLLTTSVPHFVRTGFQGRWTLDPVAKPPPSSSSPHPLIVLWMVVEASLGPRAHEWYRQAHRWRSEFTDEVARAFTEADLLLTPTTLTTAPEAAPIDDAAFLATTSGARTRVSTSTLTAPANVAGIPALAMPFGSDASGLPTSIQLHCRPGDEGTLFATAQVLEARC